MVKRGRGQPGIAPRHATQLACMGRGGKYSRDDDDNDNDNDGDNDNDDDNDDDDYDDNDDEDPIEFHPLPPRQLT